MQKIKRASSDEPLNYMPLQFLWHNQIKPQTYAVLRVTTQAIEAYFSVAETKPRCEVKSNGGRVCTDSACELFLAFPDEAESKSAVFVPRATDQLYLNIEINAVGCIYAKYGRERHGRIELTQQQLAVLDVCITHHSDAWSLSLKVPRPLLTEIAGFDVLATGCNFAYNLYKICETPACEHYAALRPLKSSVPNFHRPQDFLAVKISD